MDARRYAARHRVTLRSVFEDGIRMKLRTERTRSAFRLRDAAVEGSGLQPEFRDAGWPAVRRGHLRGSGRLTAVDTNILVYAHRADSEWHRSRGCLSARTGRRTGGLGDPVALPPRVRRDGDAPPHLQPAVDRRAGARSGTGLDGVAVTHLARRTARPLVNPPSAIARRTRAGTRRSRCPRGRDLHRARRARTSHGRPRL